MKYVDLNSGKWTSNSTSDLGYSNGSEGTWYVSSEWIRKADLISTPLPKSSENLGDNCAQSGLDGMFLKGSDDNIFLGYRAEEEEDGWSVLLELALLKSFSGSPRGLTMPDLEWDLVCLKGTSLA